MPVFNWNASHALDPSKHIERHGIRVRVEVSYHPIVQKNIVESGLRMPSPFVGWGIIDTGATVTMIGTNVVSHLNLVAIGQTRVDAVGGLRDAYLYGFKIQLVAGLEMNCLPGIGCDLPLGIDALIGMDLLSKCLLIVNGPGGVVTISN